VLIGRVPQRWEALMTLARLPGTLGVQMVAGSNAVAPTK